MPRSNNVGLFMFAAGAALLAACGSARVVQRTTYGGIVALEGDRGKAMEGAHREMANHCGPGNYQIVQEGEEVVGSNTASSDETYATHDGTVVNQGGSSTRQAVEWRVHYQCGGGGAPPPPPSGPPGGY